MNKTINYISALALITPLLSQGQKLFAINKDQKPNVIFIYADDMGKGMMSVYGQTHFRTPNMDKLVKLGVSFNNAYGCHYSAPARASLLTGYADTHQGHWLKTKGNRYCVNDTSKIAPIEKEIDAIEVTLPKGDDYLAQVFNKAGYFTGEIGKLDYGFLGTRNQIKSHGWQYFYGFLDHARCHGFYPSFLFENNKIVMIDGNTRADAGCTKAITDEQGQEQYANDRWNMEGKKQYAQDLFDAKIVEFIRAHKDEPFFLYHPSQLPHGPVSIPEVSSQVKDDPILTDLEKEYASMVIRLDETIGLILDELEKNNILDRTIVVFSADNGHEVYYNVDNRTSSKIDMVTGKKFDDYMNKTRTENIHDIFNGNMGMAGLKRSNLEGGVHVPLTYYWKNHLNPRSEDAIVSNYDFLSTMADMLNVSVTSHKTGISYLPVLMKGDSNIPENRYVLVDSYQGPAIIMNDGWKLRYTNVNGKFELFNLREDPAEVNDVSKQYPNKVHELKEILIHKVTFTSCHGNSIFSQKTLK